jgi:hypothetical protein
VTHASGTITHVTPGSSTGKKIRRHPANIFFGPLKPRSRR